MKTKMIKSVTIPLFTFVIVIVWSVAGWGEPLLTPEQVQSHFKSITTINDYVFVKGRWNRTAGNTTFHKPPRINTVYLTCDKKTMSCKETIAELLTPQEISGFEKPQLYIDENSYRILEWSNDIIRAVYLAPVANFELRISIKKKTAERYWQETKTRGVISSNANNFENWILE